MSYNKFTIGKKISLGFGVILFILLLVGTLNYLGVGGIVTNAAVVIDGNKLDAELAQREIDHLAWANKVSDLLHNEAVNELTVETDYRKCGFGKWYYGKGRTEAERLVPSLAPLLSRIEQPHKHLHESAIEIADSFQPGDMDLPAMIQGLKVAHLKWASKVRDALLQKKNELAGVETDPTQCGLGRWLSSEDYKRVYQQGTTEIKGILDNIPSEHNHLHESAQVIEEYLRTDDFDTALGTFQTKTISSLDHTLDNLDNLTNQATTALQGQKQASETFANKTAPALQGVRELLSEIRKEAKNNIMTDEGMLSSAQNTRFNVSALVIASLFLGVFVSFFISRGIVNILQKVAATMGDVSGDVSTAAGQINAACESLAEGGTEQAASLEQTGAALEQVSATINKNKDDAQESDTLMQATSLAIGNAEASMGTLSASMKEINTASEETQKIVKTIDEIAFQTNLLALNAAVEAARAGEAGAGFAVVADEVRNLAMRAAESAKNTSELIESTVEKIGSGVRQVEATSDSFDKAAQSSAKISKLISQIAVGSMEQAKGIDEINSAMRQVEEVTRVNSSSAEEIASASAEMNSQASVLRENVYTLLAMVGTRIKEKIKNTVSANSNTRSENSAPASKRPSKTEIKSISHDSRFVDDKDFEDF